MTRIGKVTIGILVVLVMLLFYFTWELLADNRVEAGNGDKQKNKQELVTGSKPNTENQEEKNPSSKSEKLDKDTDSSTKQDEQSAKQANKKKEDAEVEKNQTEHQTDQQQAEKEKAPAKEPSGTGKTIYLTFDDGPHPQATDRIIQLLEQYNAKAAFFMLQPNMRNNPELVQHMVDHGHTVGAHGVTHNAKKIYQSPQTFVQEMNTTLDFIKQTTGVASKLIRAPYGSKPYITPPFQAASDQQGFILWDWNIDSEDWKRTDGSFVPYTIQQVNQYQGHESLVVLLHERPTTADHLEGLLQYFQSNGYDMQALDAATTPVQF